MVNLKINGKDIVVNDGDTILKAALSVNIKIPTLCYLKGINEIGACRVCLVEIKGVKNLVTACCYPVSDGMEVYTNSSRVLQARKTVVELILSNHSKDCLSCIRNNNCELQILANELNIREQRYIGDKTVASLDNRSLGINRDTSKCILCGRCVSTCKSAQGLGILDFSNRGFNTKVGPALDLDFKDVNCMQCGQCVINCPVGALYENENINEVIEALNDPNKHVIVQTAPAIRASLGEEFNLPIGTRVTGKMVASLKAMQFDKVYDTNYGADLTIMEEGTEFIERISSDDAILPMLTSCSPGWVSYIESEYPELLDHVSSSKSPHQMFGAILKSYYPMTKGIDPKDIYVVSIMPCTAKKGEAKRLQMVNKDGIRDVDAVITTRELARMIKMFGIDFNSLIDEEFDQDMFGEYSGAGVIFGATGGVMEAAIRTVKDILENKSFDDIDYEHIRGMKGVKEAKLNIAGKDIWIAVVSGMKNAKVLLEDIKNKKSKYAFIEIMGCPGGCINGGGQSIVHSSFKNALNPIDYRALRASTLYVEDKLQSNRKSHLNKQIIQLYDNFLKKPGSHIAHELLHTTYSPKPKFINKEV